MSRHKPGVTPAIVIVIVVSLLLIIGLIKNAFGLYQSRSRLESTQAKVAKLELTEQSLQKNIALQAEPGSLDLIIRNKLNVALPGETIVVISSSDSGLSTPSALPISENPISKPPYLKWWQLINPS